MSISEFMDLHYRHFNAREMVAAARAWKEFLAEGGQMLVTLAGAMSSAELGISLAKMIRAGKVHAICSTAANLEEDIFNLVANTEYCVVPNYRELSVEDEISLRDRGFNRVADTCIPETVIRHIEGRLTNYWKEAAAQGKSYFPYEYFYRLLDDPTFEQFYQIPKEHSWVLAAKEMGLTIYSPGWEDSTLGNIFTARVIEGKVASHSVVKPGTMQLEHLVRWYLETEKHAKIGFFQIGGGIAGDFAICAVPLIIQDLEKDIQYWGYFAQISDAVTSYGGYSGAVPNEKITWNKLDRDTPRFMINSDASIVAPLVFAYVLGDEVRGECPSANEVQQAVERDGYCQLREHVPRSIIDQAGEELDCLLSRAEPDDGSIRAQRGTAYAARNLATIWAPARQLLADQASVSLMSSILGSGYGLVRATLFDKPPERSWLVPWHQDLTIAVREHRPASGRFCRPTTKACVPHVEAPVEVLQRMLAVRVHLDAACEDNGPLRVIPGSHRNGKLAGEQLSQCDTNSAATIFAAPGDVLLMRPLLIHSSPRSKPGVLHRRRVLHFEYAAAGELVDGYRWHQFL